VWGFFRSEAPEHSVWLDGELSKIKLSARNALESEGVEHSSPTAPSLSVFQPPQQLQGHQGCKNHEEDKGRTVIPKAKPSNQLPEACSRQNDCESYNGPATDPFIVHDLLFSTS
jgi:hypothetical protein